ncbi:MAG TPA: prepilin-type N-terminal cleavage/methylation domain-containing protein [Armatimonadota bacterium]|nr:prepilin-type N-terminal cleavage/methylation domain-containing protein [Armatimonadota bacterium]
MRRGYLLTELLVSIAILAIILVAMTRLIFMTDRAMGGEAVRAVSVGGAGELMDDLGRDLRAASGVSAADEALALRTPGESGRVNYATGSDGRSVVRTVGGQVRARYPGVGATFSASGRWVSVVVRARGADMQTGYYLRN